MLSHIVKSHREEKLVQESKFKMAMNNFPRKTKNILDKLFSSEQKQIDQQQNLVGELI